MTDRPALIEGLVSSAGRFTDSFRGLDQDVFHFKPGAERWSVAETAEHVIVAETGSSKLMRGKMIREEAPAELLAATEGSEDRIDQRLVSRDRTFPAPEFVRPTGRWQTPEEMIAVFEESRTATIEFLRTTPLDLTRYAAPHPALGPITGHGWALFLIRHCIRHIDQMEDAKKAARTR